MSINIEHKDLPLGQNHASFNWKVNNVSDLNLISVVTADINKEAYVEGTKTKYVLKSVNPAVWEAISGTGGEIDATPIDGSNNAVSSSGVYAALQSYEPANPNIQSHIISTANPHSTTASQVGAYNMVETDTKIAEAIANLAQTAPEVLNTFDELAAAMGNDPNFATTVTNLIGTINQKFIDMQEPTGFIRTQPSTMGIIELSPDGTTIYRIDQNGALTTRTDGQFATGYSYARGANAREFVIFPVVDGGSYKVYISSQLFTINTMQSILFLNTSGSQYVYHNLDGTLAVSDVFSDEFLETKPLVCVVYGNANTQDLVVFADKRHGIKMDGDTIKTHYVGGIIFVSGMGITGLSVGSTTYSTIESGEAIDADIEILIPTQTDAAFFYLNGTDWNILPDTNNIGLLIGGIAQYNQNVGGVYSLAPVLNNDCMIMFFAATGNKLAPYCKILGQQVYSDVNAAREGIESAIRNLKLTGLPSQEFLPIGAVIINASGALQPLSDGSLYLDLRNFTGGAGAIAPGSSIIIAKTTSAQSSNSTTLTPINELTVPVQANTIYRVDCFVTFRSSSTAAGAGIGFIAPTDSRPTIEFTTPTVTGASASALHLITPVAAHTTNVSIVPSSTPTVNTDMTVRMQGLLQTTSAGDFVIQFRTEDATGTITIQPKSILVIEKIG